MKIPALQLNLIIALGFGLAAFLLWGWGNRPTTEPAWPAQVAGMSFSPLRLGNDPVTGQYPTEEEIDADLSLLQGQVRAVRTYGLGGTLSAIPRLANKHGMKVTLGAWLTENLDENELELERLVKVARANHNIVQVIIGNETILRGELTVEQLTSYLDRMRKLLKLPVSSGEPWNVWLANPELAKHVDFIAAHFLPYWEGVALKAALDHIDTAFDMLQKTFPKKRVIMAEVGWPSNGRTRRAAVASQANEAIFLRNYLVRAEQNHYEYFLMEAFDQPWKSESEGAVGAYWGVFDVYRNQKFSFTEPVRRIPQWKLLAGLSVGLGLVAALILFTDSSSLRRRGRSFLALLAHGMTATLVWVIYDYTHQYQSLLTISVGICLLLGFLGICFVLLTEAHELAEASWTKKRRRFFAGTPDIELPAGKALIKVSIHVPAYNEPPEMMVETLNALAALDYPDFEVLVIDNNTKDPAVWKPVEAHCARLGERFRFFHVAPLAGFKAGALNFAIRQTAPDAEIIAVIDSDYKVSPRWLRDLIPYFDNPAIGFIQAPQDYRDADESLFKQMCHAEYKGFFHIGMVTRNDRNAIIEHGTMTMVRSSVLQEVGGWSEWCITEDAELGLRIFEAGYEGGYIEQSYGRGLMPDTFVDFKKQRFRWAYGSIQIMRRHLRALLGWKDHRLSRGQRYHFVAGWLPWLADGLNLFYTCGALLWSALIIFDPKHTDPPLAVFTIPPLALFFFKILKLIYLYRTRVRASRWQTLGAAWAGLALSHTIAKAVLAGFLTRKLPFFRTPKCENRPRLVQAILSAAEETMLALLLIGSALAVTWLQGADLPGSRLWAAALMVQSLPYLAALGMGLINTLPTRRTVQLPHMEVTNSAK
jgi:exo-beta-1,3-glucanase (GH17 family)/cellulose synthase/poly-beta-1,6-N-acetylglucosamine synthase-like glycosyltransferase/branched-subunit amino acid transport protein AzlD